MCTFDSGVRARSNYRRTYLRIRLKARLEPCRLITKINTRFQLDALGWCPSHQQHVPHENRERPAMTWRRF